VGEPGQESSRRLDKKKDHVEAMVGRDQGQGGRRGEARRGKEGEDDTLHRVNARLGGAGSAWKLER
jgi:hypothetical protein